MKKNIYSIITLFSLMSIVAITLSAQSRSDAVGVALGRATVAYSTGADALSVNPANISLFPEGSMSFALTPIGMMAGNTMMSLNDVNYYFGGVQDAKGKVQGRVLNDSERDAFLQKFNAGTIATQFDVNLLSAVYKIDDESAAAFSINTTVQSSLTLPGTVGQLIAGYAGYRPLELRDAAANALAYTAYQLSYSSKLWAGEHQNTTSKLYAGASLKLIRGLYYTALDEANMTTITPYTPSGWDSTKNWAIDMNISRRSSGALTSNQFSASYLSGMGAAQGNGVGFDLGASYLLQSQNSVPTIISLALLDIGAISWADGIVERIQLRDTIKAVAQIEQSQLDRYQPVSSKESLSSALPTRLRLGGSTRFDDALAQNHHLHLMAEYTQGFNHSGANTTTPRFGIGAEATQLDYIPALRMGLQLGGVEGFLWTAGFGWNIMHTVSLDVSVGSMQTVFSPSNSKWIDAAFRVRVDI